MKKSILLLMVISLLATVAVAQGDGTTAVFGARAGYSISPDQLFIGGQVDLGMIAGPMRVVPNIEIGFGNDLTVMAFNGDLIYDIEDTPWGVGGELGIIHSSLNDFDVSNTDVGMSALGEYRFPLNNGKILTAQAKLGLTNSPDFKILAAYNF